MKGPKSRPLPAPLPSTVPKIETPDTTTPATSAPVVGSIAAHSTTYPSGRSRSGAIGAFSGAAISANQGRGRPPKAAELRPGQVAVGTVEVVVARRDLVGHRRRS